MTDGALVEVLAGMRRSEASTDAMTRIFGILYHDELPRGRAARLVKEYTERWKSDPERYPLDERKQKPQLNSAPINDGIRIAPYVEVLPKIARRWRP